MKALIVVSNRFWGLAVREVARNCGFDVEMVGHGEALVGFRRLNPDVIVVCEYESEFEIFNGESQGVKIFRLLKEIIAPGQVLIGAGFVGNGDGNHFLRMPFSEKELLLSIKEQRKEG